ncbi:MAG: hypothetical protein H7Y11_12590 [Armatimonadetes bacterium]|nr:hypothetical protein [Anaerolineae bacterium]
MQWLNFLWETVLESADSDTDLRVDHRVYKRHFHAESEPYSGCDALLALLERKWLLPATVHLDAHDYNGRIITVYCFALTQRDHTLHIKVIANPMVERLIRNQGLRTVWNAQSCDDWDNTPLEPTQTETNQEA